MHVRSVVFALLPFAVVAVSCGGKVEATTAQNPGPMPAYTAPPPTSSVAPTTAPSAPPPTSSGPATPIAPMAAAVVAPLLTQMSQAEAPGAQADGQPFAGQFAAGQTLEQTINIKANGCYTVVGASVGIQQLDITLVVTPPPPIAPITVAQSSGTGPNATLGGKATGCWRNPTPLAGTGKVILRASAGQGLAAAQVFSK